MKPFNKTEQVIVCTNCGEENSLERNVCSSCGVKLNKAKLATVTVSNNIKAITKQTTRNQKQKSKTKIRTKIEKNRLIKVDKET